MNKTRVIFHSIKKIVGTEDLSLLILTDMVNERQLTVVCDADMAHQFDLRLAKIPITGIMLPEALWNMMRMQTGSEYELVIYDVDKGRYEAMLVEQYSLQSVKLRASDAILMSYISRIPLYMEERLYMRQSVPFEEDPHKLTVPVNAISTDMLKKALDKAIDEENYELASHLRDELLSRNKENNKKEESEGM